MNEDNISNYFEDMYNRLPDDQAVSIPTLQAVTARVEPDEEGTLGPEAETTGHFSHVVVERPNTACVVQSSTINLKKRAIFSGKIKFKSKLATVVEEAKYLTHQLKD